MRSGGPGRSARGCRHPWREGCPASWAATPKWSNSGRRKSRRPPGRGHGQVVAVVGEPGVGKSRLFYEFINSHRSRGWLVLESASVSYGKATAYLPVIDLLKSYFRIESRDDARTIREKVGGKVLMLDRTLDDTI